MRAHQDLAANGPEGLGLMPERLGERHQLGVSLAAALVCIGILELLRQREKHVFSVRQPQRDGRLAKAHLVLALVLGNPLDVLGTEIAGVADQFTNGLDLPVLLGRLQRADAGV